MSVQMSKDFTTEKGCPSKEQAIRVVTTEPSEDVHDKHIAARLLNRKTANQHFELSSNVEASSSTSSLSLKKELEDENDSSTCAYPGSMSDTAADKTCGQSNDEPKHQRDTYSGSPCSETESCEDSSDADSICKAIKNVSSLSSRMIDPEVTIEAPDETDLDCYRPGIRDFAKLLKHSKCLSEVSTEQLERVKLMHDRFAQEVSFSFNYGVLLLVSSMLAGLGLVSNSSTTVIASMLVSPVRHFITFSLFVCFLSVSQLVWAEPLHSSCTRTDHGSRLRDCVWCHYQRLSNGEAGHSKRMHQFDAVCCSRSCHWAHHRSDTFIRPVADT